MKEKLHSLIRERFKGYTEVQRRAIPLVESGKNVLVLAPTGSGKTEAALLPVFEKLIDYNAQPEMRNIGIRCIYITPLRALNRDMLSRVEWWCEKIGISLAVRHGDTSQQERKKQSHKPPVLLITTPETFQSLLITPSFRSALRNLRHLVVDEIHSLYENKRGAQLSIGLERLEELTPNFQRIGLSATVGDAKEAAKFLVGIGGGRQCEIIDVKFPRPFDMRIELPVPRKEDKKLADELRTDEQASCRLRELDKLVHADRALIFVNTRQIAESLTNRLLALKSPIAIHHGSLSREVRHAAEDKFKRGQLKALLCTSSLELGIDIGDLDLVVQYMSPKQVGRLVQRVGRSGHGLDRTPRGVVIASDADDLLESIAVVRLMRKNELEKKPLEKGALDVIAHQLVGLALTSASGEGISLEKAHAVMCNAASYGISLPDLAEIARQLASERILSFNPEAKTARAHLTSKLYYFHHLSTIPKEKKFRVRNSVTNSIVSLLDEGFVATLEKGCGFITKGVPWIVLDIDEKECELVVEPAEGMDFAVPDWEGDEIPVPYEIAQEVGRLRREVAAGKWNAIAHEISFKGEAKFPLQKLLPDERTVCIECSGDIAVIHACFGSRINATISRALSAMLSAKFGSSIRVIEDPYRIILQLPNPAKAETIRTYLLNIFDARAAVAEPLPRSSLFRFKFIHVARAFGLLSEDAVVGRRLVEHFKGSPVFRETTRAVLRNYLDVDGATRVLADMRGGKLRLVCEDVRELSPLAQMGISKAHAGELIAPIEPSSEILKAFKRSVLDKRVRFLCTYCKAHQYYVLNDIPKKIKCEKCGSPLLAAEGELVKGIVRRERSPEDLKLSASLVDAYGRRAAIALSVYGVGPQTAVRVLQRMHRNEDLLFLDLLEAQKQFIRTKRYWQL